MSGEVRVPRPRPLLRFLHAWLLGYSNKSQLPKNRFNRQKKSSVWLVFSRVGDVLIQVHRRTLYGTLAAHFPLFLSCLRVY